MKKPHPEKIIEALMWARQGFPVLPDIELVELTKTIIQALQLLPQYDKLYAFGTEENKAAYFTIQS